MVMRQVHVDIRPQRVVDDGFWRKHLEPVL